MGIVSSAAVPPRSEAETFLDLAGLCTSPGYAHAIAFLCFRDNIVGFAGEVTAEDLSHLSSMANLSRTEIATLIGLMVKAPVDHTLPTPKQTQDYVARTDALLAELHDRMSLECFFGQDWKKLAEEGGNPFQKGRTYREPIFYGGESAYLFQYVDLAGRKYEADDDWLLRNKGYTIGSAQAVVRAALDVHREKLRTCLEGMPDLSPSAWDLLPAYLLTTRELADRTGIEVAVVERVLDSLAMPEGAANEQFCALDDFNATNATPLLRHGPSRFLLFQTYSLAEALYEAPFYWMNADRAYRGAAMNNRGRFAEDFAADRLRRVFGDARVHVNVDIFQSKDRKLGEVDVLVVFGNRAIVLQAKSKRLTLEARKGNDQVIKDDFRKSVQDSYDQGHLCASLLTGNGYHFVDASGKELVFDRVFKEIYVLCVVSDHYPALGFQARQFLVYQETNVIRPPFVLDVFTLDAMTEMLESPLRFLSYVHRRTLYAGRLHASELAILSYHLKKNLWLDGELSMTVLDESVTADLDIAMMARRDGIPGRTTPDGILTRYAGTTLWRLIEDIEARADPGTIDLGLMLLMLSGDTIADANRAIDRAAASTRRDGKTHDVTMGLGDTGFTVHCTDQPVLEAMAPLRRHCEGRKYTEKVDSWFGVCVGSADARLRFGVSLDYPWKQDASMDDRTLSLPRPAPDLRTAMREPVSKRKIGRNDPCPCGSGVKYKKCCLK